MNMTVQGGLGVWWRTLRTYSPPASVVPVLVGTALALGSGGEVAWGLLPVVLVCAVLFHAGTNVINDYFDLVGGVDKDDPHGGSSGVLVKDLLRPPEIFAYGVSLFRVGVLLGIVLTILSWPADAPPRRRRPPRRLSVHRRP